MMSRRLGRLVALALTAATLVAPRAVAAQESSSYRLTAPALTRFERATHALATLARRDPSLTSADSRTMPPEAERALRGAGMRQKEFMDFFTALFEAGLASGAVNMGMKPSEVPPITRANMAFIKVHEARIAALGPDIRTLQEAGERQAKKARAESEESGDSTDQGGDPPTL